MSQVLQGVVRRFEVNPIGMLLALDSQMLGMCNLTFQLPGITSMNRYLKGWGFIRIILNSLGQVSLHVVILGLLSREIRAESLPSVQQRNASYSGTLRKLWKKS